MKFFDRLLLPENLYFAWRKARRLYNTSDGYTDQGEVAEFELNLEAELNAIRKKFISGKYRTKKLRPLPRPKKLDGEQQIDRQYYHVAVTDQVAWIAVVNALGPELDQNMSSWSYGNRLYRAAWYEEDEEGLSKLEIGPYRHSSGYVYRKFQHSWPLFRRHVSLTARTMVSRKSLIPDELDDADQRAFSAAEREKLIYLETGYWNDAPKMEEDNSLYYASIDLKQFFPSLNVEPILAGLAKAVPENDDRVASILEGMLEFHIDHKGISRNLIENVEPQFPKHKALGLPTGLYVAGFLSNVAMTEVDKSVGLELENNRGIAHFRFVDDHTILAYNFDDLCNWISWYEELLERHRVGSKINSDKYDPKSLIKWMNESKGNKAENKADQVKSKKLRTSAIKDTRVDGKNPTKLMTKTLTQVSAIAADDIHVLDDDDLQERLRMLEWLLGANIDEREIRADTRAAFATGKIAQLVPALSPEEKGLVNNARKLAELRRKSSDFIKSPDKMPEGFQTCLDNLESEVQLQRKKQIKSEDRINRKYFDLLFSAMQKFPGKPRLFFRLFSYCKDTGHDGLSEISEWIERMYQSNNQNWANYFSGLAFQILGQNAVSCSKILTKPGILRSRQKAAERHLQDIAKNSINALGLGRESMSWFHSLARKEFGVSLLVASKFLEENVSDADVSTLASNLSQIAIECLGLSAESSNKEWVVNSGKSPGVWAFMFEPRNESRDEPSASWRMFSTKFEMTNKCDANAIRWYPESISKEAWDYLLQSKGRLLRSDSAWVNEVLKNDEQRQLEANSLNKKVFKLVARALTPLEKQITLEKWVEELANLSPFDPRAAEWTAFEIMRILISRVINKGSDGANRDLDRLHPLNVLLPLEWIEEKLKLVKYAGKHLNWFEWRSYVQTEGEQSVKLRKATSSIVDYRFANYRKYGMKIDDWQRQLVAVGFMLLGLVRKNFDTPRIWNIRGHENIYRAPRSQWYESLKVSSQGLLLI